MKPQKQLSQPYFQDGDGGMLVLFCGRILGKRSSAPFGPSSSPLVVEPGFVCIIFALILYAIFSYAMNVLHSLRKTRNLLLSGSSFFAFKSGTLWFRCFGHHSQRGGGRFCVPQHKRRAALCRRSLAWRHLEISLEMWGLEIWGREIWGLEMLGLEMLGLDILGLEIWVLKCGVLKFGFLKCRVLKVGV